MSFSKSPNFTIVQTCLDLSKPITTSKQRSKTSNTALWMIVPSIEPSMRRQPAAALHGRRGAHEADQAELGLLITSVKNSIKKAARN